MKRGIRKDGVGSRNEERTDMIDDRDLAIWPLRPVIYQDRSTIRGSEEMAQSGNFYINDEPSEVIVHGSSQSDFELTGKDADTGGNEEGKDVIVISSSRLTSRVT
jgi:hypothetical protein